MCSCKDICHNACDCDCHTVLVLTDDELIAVEALLSLSASK
jgi:hypothetical protein